MAPPASALMTMRALCGFSAAWGHSEAPLAVIGTRAYPRAGATKKHEFSVDKRAWRAFALYTCGAPAAYGVAESAQNPHRWVDAPVLRVCRHGNAWQARKLRHLPGRMQPLSRRASDSHVGIACALSCDAQARGIDVPQAAA